MAVKELSQEAMEQVFQNAMGTSMGMEHALETSLPGLPGLKETLIDEIFVTGVVAGVGMAVGEGIAGRAKGWARTPIDAWHKYRNKNKPDESKS